MTAIALGLVRSPSGTPRVDRSWNRALVIRHAREQRLQLVDILELDDDEATLRTVLPQLAGLAGSCGADVLVTHGVSADLAGTLAQDLGLAHLPVPYGPTRPHREDAEVRGRHVALE